MKKIALILLLSVLTIPAWALDDTTANRDQQATRYLNATPPKDMLRDIVENMTKNVTVDKREEFKNLMLKNFDIDAMTKIMKQAMVKNFNADELKALADFYGSPVGKSAMKKMGAYMADAMPAIQQEVVKAINKSKPATAN